MTTTATILNLFSTCSPLCWHRKIMSRKRQKVTDLKHHDKVPYDMRIYKGAKSWKLPRSFVSFLLTDTVVQQFLEWSRVTWVSDEMVVPTLARISQVKRGEMESQWVVEQGNVPSPNDHFQLWWSGCRGVMR